MEDVLLLKSWYNCRAVGSGESKEAYAGEASFP